MKNNKKILGTGVLTAIASSLCCITPILAMISGSSGLASSFSWLEPFRPYLLVFTVAVLIFAWFQKLKPKKEIDCNCDAEDTSFLQSKLFLAMVTLFAIIMMMFPYYSSNFYSQNHKEIIDVNTQNVQTVKLKIDGMTCSSCEEHINYSINQLKGIIKVNSSYEKGYSEVKFDKSKIGIEDIKKAINSTGYTVKK
ncbi:MAG TPA: mercuric transport protein MerTP [Crocinitomix sp.]|nr:mercuric transport protein MerTP [Crocinitomix sp.]